MKKVFEELLQDEGSPKPGSMKRAAAAKKELEDRMDVYNKASTR
jgi:hypothetical protein